VYSLPLLIKNTNTDQGLIKTHGIYFVDKKGRRVYLKDKQKQAWKNGSLIGCIETL
jgi:hypothetical protein